MIKFRIDVDYSYPSRIKSFIYTALNFRSSKEYLKNSKTLARMFNESKEKIKVYWFFTIKTVPDEKLLKMLNNHKHEIAIHIVKSPFKELKFLSEIVKRRINYYTIHGTSNLLTRFLWRRWETNVPNIPKNFPLMSFHQYATLPFDALCYREPSSVAYEIAQKNILKNKILEIHPEWLFQRGKINRRGSYFKALKKILKIDKELEYLTTRKKIFMLIAKDSREYAKDILPNDRYIKKLTDLKIDIFTFIERKWSNQILHPDKKWKKTIDNVAILKLSNFDSWWKKIGKKTRNLVRKAKKSGVFTRISSPNLELAKGIWQIYNETPIRQKRVFPHYGINLKKVEEKTIFSSNNHIFIGSYFEKKLVGFVDLIIGENIAIISQILSIKKHWNKAINNALIAKTVEVCLKHKKKWLMYGRMGNHPSLDKFKKNTGFQRLDLNRYYVMLTLKGRIGAKLGLHRDLKDVLPQSIIIFLIPIYNWFSKIKMKKIA